MKESNDRKRPEERLTFETTDFADARRALDEPPAGLEVARLLREPSWAGRRRPPEPTDHAILGRTVDWLLQLAPAARPTRLADAIPRIANALADRWSDPPPPRRTWATCWSIGAADARGSHRRSSASW